MKKIINFSCFACLIVGIFLFLANQSMATTYCVSNEANLIAALNEAKGNGSDDVIKIQQGTYYGNFVYASTESFGVTIEGGYTALCASRVVDPANTVLDGGENGTVLVLSSPDLPTTFGVEGITLQNGKTNNQGGGLYVLNKNGLINVKDSNILNNESIGHGGGIRIGTGGGIVNIDNSKINFNKSPGPTGPGGGINITAKNVSINNSEISGNEAKRYGGGIQLNVNDFLLANSIISNNSAEYGGGLNFGSPNDPMVNDSITISNNLIANNFSSGRGVNTRTI